jgi:hypothetical protein
MGEIVADLELENFGDRVLQRRGYLPEEKVRQLMVKAVVDTGAVLVRTQKFSEKGKAPPTS